MIVLSIGKWWIRLLNFGAIGDWAWRRPGFDDLFYEWRFGFALQLGCESDRLRAMFEGP